MNTGWKSDSRGKKDTNYKGKGKERGRWRVCGKNEGMSRKE